MKAHTLSKKLSAAAALTAQIQQAQLSAQASPEKTPTKSTPPKPNPKPIPTPPSHTEPIDPTLFAAALREGIDDPRFSAVSTPAKSVMAYLNSTVPKFSTSALVRKYVETGLAADYPHLWGEVPSRARRARTNRANTNKNVLPDLLPP